MANSRTNLTRRNFGAQVAWAAAAACAGTTRVASSQDRTPPRLKLRYVLASPLYGTAPLTDVLAEAANVGAHAVDVWPRPHANHREQIDELGLDRVAQLLDDRNVQLAVITRYDLGPYRLQPEMPILRRLGGKLLVTGAHKTPGDSPKERARKFVENMRPHVAEAEKQGVTIGIENHAGSLLESPDSIRYFADAIESPHLGLAMAPYHLPQDPVLIADLIAHLGGKLVFFQAWQHGNGCQQKLPKQEELLQMPGRGPLDFTPLLAALLQIEYPGWTEIFMHTVPRGIPIHEHTAAVTDEINRSRTYLERCLSQLNQTAPSPRPGRYASPLP